MEKNSIGVNVKKLYIFQFIDILVTVCFGFFLIIFCQYTIWGNNTAYVICLSLHSIIALFSSLFKEYQVGNLFPLKCYFDQRRQIFSAASRKHLVSIHLKYDFFISISFSII